MVNVMIKSNLLIVTLFYAITACQKIIGSAVDFSNCPVSKLLIAPPNASRQFNFYPLEYYDGNQRNPYDPRGSFRQELMVPYNGTMSYPCSATAFTVFEREKLRCRYVICPVSLTCSNSLCPITNDDIGLKCTSVAER